MTTRPRTHRPHAGPLQREPVPNWSKLSRADDIEIYRDAERIATGRIDMLAIDGSMLWLHHDGGNGRALFLHSDRLRVYRRPR